MIEVERVKDALLKENEDKVRGSRGHTGALKGCRVAVLTSIWDLESLWSTVTSAGVFGQ